MIASVVATLDESDRIGHVLEQLAGLPNLEVGEVTNPRRIPITIDSPLPRALEETTNAIQHCDGVAFVDVVFVHFEDESREHPSSAPTGTEPK